MAGIWRSGRWEDEFPQEAEGVFGLSALNVPLKHLTGLIPAIRDHFPPQESENLGVKSWDVGHLPPT